MGNNAIRTNGTIGLTRGDVVLATFPKTEETHERVCSTHFEAK